MRPPVTAAPLACALLVLPIHLDPRPVPRLPLAGVEAEAMTVVSAFGGPASVQDMAAQGFSGRWSDGKQLFWKATGTSSRLVLQFKSPVQGAYRPILRYTQAPDYGLVAVHLDDDRVAVVDGYAASVVRTYLRLPERTFASGEAVLLKFDAFARTERSSGLFFGVDRLEFEPIARAPDLAPRSGVCAAGGTHEASPSSQVHVLPTVARGLANGRWCHKCGAAFLRNAKGDEQAGGVCTVLGKAAVGLGAGGAAPAHEGNTGPDLHFPLAEPGAPGPRVYSCDGCHGLYSDLVPHDGATNMCAVPGWGTHRPYKGDVYALTKVSPTSAPRTYRICAKCALVYSVHGWGPMIQGASALPGDCPANPKKGAPHVPWGDLHFTIAYWPETGEPYWLRCQKCRVLYFVPDVPGTAGRCPCGGPHDGTWGPAYALVRDPSLTLPTYGRECHKCGTLFGGAVMGGACAAGGKHEILTPYAPGQLHQMVLPTQGAGDAHWRRCAKCESFFRHR